MGVAVDWAARLNCPHCQNQDTNDHYMHFYIEPTVVAARWGHHKLVAAAIYTCELKKTTAEALTAMYSLGAQGWHIDPQAIDNDACENLVDGLIITIKEIRLVKAALIAL